MNTQSLIANCLNEVQRHIRDAKRRGQQQGIGAKTIPIIEQMLDAIVRLDETERQAIILGQSRDDSLFLLGIAQSMAEVAVQEANPSKLRYGLIALIVENCQVDWRETVVHLCLLNNSACKLDVDLEQVFLDLNLVASPDTTNLIEGYFREGVKDIHEMDYIETEGPDGFAYKRTW